MDSLGVSSVAPQHTEPKKEVGVGRGGSPWAARRVKTTCSMRNPREMAKGDSDPTTGMGGERCCESYKFLCLLGICQHKSLNTP